MTRTTTEDLLQCRVYWPHYIRLRPPTTRGTFSEDPFITKLPNSSFGPRPRIVRPVDSSLHSWFTRNSARILDFNHSGTVRALHVKSQSTKAVGSCQQSRHPHPKRRSGRRLSLIDHAEMCRGQAGSGRRPINGTMIVASLVASNPSAGLDNGRCASRRGGPERNDGHLDRSLPTMMTNRQAEARAGKPYACYVLGVCIRRARSG